MRRSGLAGWFALIALAFAAAAGHAETTVAISATYPAGKAVHIGTNQNFYMRIRYATDTPVHIWVAPYSHGREVPAGTSPSGVYTGTGEALTWFFLMKPDNDVDEIRIRVGDGSRDGTHVAMTYPVNIATAGSPIAAGNEPAWVVDMKRQLEVEQRQAYEKRMQEPSSPGEDLLFAGFMLLVYGLGILACISPLLGLRRWRGGWRVAAAIPAALMGFVILRIIVGVSIDPTSHNLWPFEILMSGALSAALMLALWLARKIRGVAA